MNLLILGDNKVPTNIFRFVFNNLFYFCGLEFLYVGYSPFTNGYISVNIQFLKPAIMWFPIHVLTRVNN